MTAEKIQAAYDWISSVAAEGDTVSTASWSGSLSDKTKLAAKETETLKDGLSKLYSTISTKKTGEIITAEYFKSVKDAMDSASISSSACDECNAKC